MDEMSVWLDDRTDFGEAFFLLATVRPPIKGMDEMSVRLDDHKIIIKIKNT